ncbi:MAG: excinuclease ABC subunit UvrC [Paludibacteraceae bacterium]|jgi:excinuclease ABC subunit C|nr:excinuclease ABC subunit UvrC [Paludibacteraceae bacterium]MEE0912066.1 excinuclease ABC subunit UvrC [Paludibacteraceae bacterium]
MINTKEISPLKQIVLSLPESPGIYQYLNEKEEIIYVGKAKNLKRRVSSYFNKEQQSVKTKVLVKQIHDIKYIVVENEQDALLLENSLIKKFQPRYNILLKDGKTYPWICIKNEFFPRVFKTRNLVKDGSKYYGPYTYGPAIKTILELIEQIFPLRTCKLDLTSESIHRKNYKVCLQYHIKKCAGCCEGLQSREEYDENIKKIKSILKGEISEIEDDLKKEMISYAENLEFEKAQKVKEKLEILAQYKSKSTIVNPLLTNIDTFAIEIDDSDAFINYLKVTNGTITQAYTLEYKIRTEEEKEEILASAIIELRNRFKSQSKEILLPFDINYELNGVTITVPQRGDKKKLLDLSIQNVKQYKFDRLKQREKFNPEQRAAKLLNNIRNLLKLNNLPIQIECFDNSNIQGSDAVAACVVYKMAKPSKKDYRKYNIKSVVGPDDYASMREVVRRRYTRLIEEESPLPQLIIADGGIGQMEVIREVIEDELKLSIPIAGLAKNEKHKTKELLFGFPPKVVGMDPNDEVFRFFASIQDEVHRYAIKFHREKRSKNQVKSELEIKGIGPKTREQLIKRFKSVKRIKELSINELENEIGNSKAQIIFQYFHKENK